MGLVLLSDFGSTYTKLTVVDTRTSEILASASSATTVETDVMEGFKLAFRKITNHLGDITIDDTLVCSSAAGGLKMVASGLVASLTGESAKMACLGSGAKVLETYAQKLTKRDMGKIADLNPDMILLAGGTDGGNVECILHNAKAVSEHLKSLPIVVAGNKDAQDDIADIFDEAGVVYKIADNVMPSMNKVSIESTQEIIRDMFMERIVDAKGMEDVRKELSEFVKPTPMMVMKACELLSEGYEEIPGWGDLIVVDIGGATTDIHSACDGYPSLSTVALKGLEEPFIKRTVEGDLGMRVSALSLKGSVGIRDLMEESDFDKAYIEKRCTLLNDSPELISTKEIDIKFDQLMASMCVKHAIKRHMGKIETVYTPMGTFYYQTGKDLSKVSKIIGTGGILVNNKEPREVLENAVLDNDSGISLHPKNPAFYIDNEYILSTCGLLSEKYPRVALEIMHKNIGKVD